MVSCNNLLSYLFTLSVLTRCHTKSYRILAFFPFPIFSHQVPFFKVLDQLVAQGHDLTLVAAYPLANTNASLYKYIHVPQPFPKQSRDPMLLSGITGHALIRTYSNFCINRLEKIMNLPPVQDLIRHDNSTYDVIISEVTFCGLTHASLAHKFGGIPLINFQPLGYEPAVYSLLGNLLPPGSAVDVRLPYTDELTWWQRAYTTYMYLADLYDMYYYMLPALEQMMKSVYDYPGSETRPPLLSLLHNMTLTLVDYDPAIIGLSFPVAPNVLFAGGAHIRAARPLPSCLERFMTVPGRRGVILVSLGTILEFSHLGEDVVRAFLVAFEHLKDYGVIWKLDVKVEVPENLLVGDWFPQEDILGHPNCKLFITHGGIHSAMETIYHAVPVVMMPAFSDQFQNVQIMSNKGIGLIISHKTISGENLHSSIIEVLLNPKYKRAVDRLSKQVRSLPYHNLHRAVRWIEYVAENQEAPSLRPHARKSSFVELLCLDWYLVVVCCVLAILYFLVALFKCILYGCWID